MKDTDRSRHRVVLRVTASTSTSSNKADREDIEEQESTEDINDKVNCEVFEEENVRSHLRDGDPLLRE